MLGAYSCSDNDEPTDNPGPGPGDDTTKVVEYSQLKINEINGNGEDADKYIELYNGSDKAINLEGVALWYNNVSSDPEITWIGDPSDSIAAKGFLLLKGAKKDKNPDSDLQTGLSSKQGIRVALQNPDGVALDSFRIHADENRDNAYSRIPDGTGDFYYTAEAGTQGLTNGASTTGLTKIVILPSLTGVARSVATPVPQQKVVVSATAIAHFGTSLSSVKLKWKLNNVAQTDITMIANGDKYSDTIPGQANGAEIIYFVEAVNENGAVQSVADTFTVAALTVDYSGLVINEVDGNGKFVELYNKGAASISLEGVTLVKNETGTWWTGGANVNIAAGGRYTIAQSGGAEGANEYTGNGGISPKKTVKFEVKKPNGDLIDSFARVKTDGALDVTCAPDYGTTTPQYSFSRCPDGTGNFGLAVSSCNAANPATQEGAIVTN